MHKTTIVFKNNNKVVFHSSGGYRLKIQGIDRFGIKLGFALSLKDNVFFIYFYF